MTAGPPRRVLMICYYFPPLLSSGSNRSVGFARNLAGFGWTPVVLTVKRSRNNWEPVGAPVPADVEIVRSVEFNLHRLIEVCDAALGRLLKVFGLQARRSYIRDALCFPDAQIAWMAIPAGARLARRADCVYVSCSPFSAAIAGVFIARLARKPLVLDFRDAWSLNPYGRRGKLRSRLENFAEKWTLGRAAALIVNTPGSKHAYAQKYPERSFRLICIPNGYDELKAAAPTAHRDAMFSVMHVGEFYGSRQPDNLLEALAALAFPDMEFVQVGPPCHGLERYRSRVRMRQIDSLPRDEALRLMQTASLLYLKVGRASDGPHIAVPAKAYEYLASGIPILADCPPGDAADLVREYGTSTELVLTDSTEELAAALMRAYARRHDAPLGVDARFVFRYSRGNLTSQLAELLNQVVGVG